MWYLPDFTFLCCTGLKHVWILYLWLVMDLLILKTRNNWAGDGQQQFTWLADQTVMLSCHGRGKHNFFDNGSIWMLWDQWLNLTWLMSQLASWSSHPEFLTSVCLAGTPSVPPFHSRLFFQRVSLQTFGNSSTCDIPFPNFQYNYTNCSFPSQILIFIQDRSLVHIHTYLRKYVMHG